MANNSISEIPNLNFSSNGSDHLCQIALIVLKTPGFTWLLISEIFFGVIGVILNIPLIFVYWRVKVFHSNLRILLIHFNFSLLWYSMDYIIKGIILLPMTLGIGNPCTLSMPMFTCRVQEIPFSIPVQLAVYGQLAIGLERLYSTIRYRKYSQSEKCGKFPIVACILIPLCYVIPITNIVNSLLKMPKSGMVPICENLLSMTPSSATTSLGNNLSALFVTVFCVIIVSYWNSYKLRNMLANTANCTLSARFQIDQNVQVNQMIVPDTVLQLCCYIPNYIFMLLIVVGLPLTYEMKTILVHINYIWKITYAIAHPAVVLKRNGHVRRRAKEMTPSFIRNLCHCHQEVAPAVATVEKERRNQAQAHFQILQDVWNRPAI